ncbi:helix-turn-helix domain-containing protein [Gottfriedia solisilvae]|uniref:Transcriptional regulator n=1 Tax=Gottfriedia solisilvae TaxID=1516104 RepID=A0A8J3ASX1_9BACI|nr:XRE family transcriptional regulator [Gottfriedia solisilvae]GGI18264.1 transcriptional regulator [Gottfriedia solisilvae]
MEELNLIIAKNLKSHREKKKLSLEKVAELTGVSKTMVGQIERGESSPTITTLWKIANGLKISFTSLIENPPPEARVIRKNEVHALTEDNGKYRVYPFFPFDEKRRFEVYSVELDKGGMLNASPHGVGTEEFITVFEGELTLTVNGTSHIVEAGNSIQFKADREHTYFNSGETLTRVNMVIYYPV